VGLEKTIPYKADGGLMPSSVQAVKELRFLTGLTASIFLEAFVKPIIR
jgi:hypothetical protein